MDGKQMRELRKRHKLSQRELAELIGISTSQVSRLELGEDRISEGTEAKLTEHLLDEQGSVAGPDALPDPPLGDGFDSDGSEDEPEPEPERPARRRSPGRPASRTLTKPQQEAVDLIVLTLRGQSFTFEHEGAPVTVTTPGVCHAIGSAWCPVCAQVVATASEPFAAALIRAYPQLANLLSRPGSKAELLLVVVTQIVFPCAMHHVRLPQQQQGSNGSGPAGVEEPQMGEPGFVPPET